MVENLGLLAPLFGGEEMHFDQFVGSETPSHQIRSARNLLLKRFSLIFQFPTYLEPLAPS